MLLRAIEVENRITLSKFDQRNMKFQKEITWSYKEKEKRP